MKNLSYILFAVFGCLIIFSCNKIDVDEEILIEKTYFLNGMIDEEPYEIIAGMDDVLIDAELAFGDPSGIRSKFQKSYFCLNDCLGTFELQYFWPNSIFITTSSYEQRHPFEVYEFAGEEPNRDFNLVINYEDNNGINYTSTSVDNTAHRLHITNYELSSNSGGEKVEIMFDCDLINSNGEIIQLRNFEGVIKM